MKFSRQLKYYYLRFLRLRGQPEELALGMAFGVFAGMMPIMPFQTAVAVTLAIFFKGSKITAAIGTWISNPLNLYLVYFYNFKLGAFLLGIPKKSAGFSAIMAAIRSGEEAMVVVGELMSVGGTTAMAFLVGGVVMGTLTSIPTYLFFLYSFRRIKSWRQSRREMRNGRLPEQ
ncbi:MAG: DUF2062 domain-containing protein [Desulfatiglans sp.]|nr:DUF2062 domain-containing protein [Thermodesulfobacteriota bacterium]MEE4353272.1 DUF2062 domain-containing protein [Desulfatiglans sp.]